jgi:hypothetical protein
VTIDDTALTLNSDCYCWPIERRKIVDKIIEQGAVTNMAALLSERPHYFASTSVFLSQSILTAMTDQIRVIEDVIKLPGYIEAVKSRSSFIEIPSEQTKTEGVFMGYDFHITEKGPRLIEINSNAGGAFIVDMLEQSVHTSSGDFAKRVLTMFETEWAGAGRTDRLKSIAIVDRKPEEQYHYPDMCLAKSLLQKQGLYVVVADPEELIMTDGQLYYNAVPIDLVYNRLTDFDLSESSNAIIRRAYEENVTVVTPAPHHHALYADKRNLILLSDQDRLAKFGASRGHRKILQAIPATTAVTNDKAEMMWNKRRHLFFKPQAGFGSRGAFRGAKLTKKVWGEILSGGYIAQEMVTPPIRAVTVNGEKTALKFDVRIYTYDGQAFLLAARVYQGQTTNLRTAGGGLAPVIPVSMPVVCG